MVRTIALTLTILCLHCTVYAQSNGGQDREKQPSQSPSVGTAGSVGGPKGLFTIYDGSTIRKGEFTFSIAYSNYDRDPENVDIRDFASTLNVGLKDHLVFFSKTNGYRGIKIHAQNLSRFYLQNAQAYASATRLCAPACNIGSQPSRRFPFASATRWQFGVGRPIAPGFTKVVGRSFGGNGSFVAASKFPGSGSPVVAYLPDAPFVNRPYESSLTDLVAGAKVRLTGPNNDLGVGFIPFYRWNPEKVSDLHGFKSEHPEVFGFRLIATTVGSFATTSIRNSPSLTFVDGIPIFERFLQGDEFTIRGSNVRSISPITSVDTYLWLLADARDFYVAGNTPNALNNNQVEVNHGVRIVPGLWWELGAANRDRLSQPDLSTDPENDVLTHTWTVTSGKISGEGRNVTWDLSGAQPGSYTSSVTVSDSKKPFKEDSVSKTARDYFAATFNVGRHLTSRSAVAFLSSQNIYGARTWTRSSYSVVNNPLTHLTLGMFIWDRDVSELDKQRIRATLDLDPEHAKKICALYGADSRQCRIFKEAVEAWGPEGVDNGVTFAVGSVHTKGAGAETTVTPCGKWKTKTKDNPTGQRTTVTITKETVNSEGLIHVVRHEASHVADGLKWRASGCRLSSNPFLRETEFKAYTVTSLSAQAYKPHVAFGFFLRGGGLPGKATYLPEIVPIYRPGLKAEDLEILRDAGIDKLLERPKDAGGLYGLTLKSPGGHAFGFQQ